MTDARVVRYSGRLEGPGHDDETHPSTIAALARTASVIMIDDPLSFPWDSMTSPIDAALIVDISTCAYSDRLALRPIFESLTAADVIVDSSPGSGTIANIAATLVSKPPAPLELQQRHVSKASLLAERRIEERLRREFDRVVVIASDPANDGFDDVATAARSASSTDTLVVRVDASALAQHDDFEAYSTALLRACDRRSIDGVWGVRASPGRPLERALIIIPGESA